MLDISTLQPGDRIEGRYKYFQQIGKGAFGTVLLVEDTIVDDRLILKFLNPNVASDEEMMKRFVHELRYSRKITHKNVIRI
jgi:serine/threonine-protein kinase